MFHVDIEKNRTFPAMKASDDLVIVIPDDLIGHASITQLSEALVAYGASCPDIMAQCDFTEEFYQAAHIVACGNLTNNVVIERLYTLRYTFVDTFFPGADGYFIKTISDPFGYGLNTLVVGASYPSELIQALGVFTRLIETHEGDLTRLHAHQFNHEIPQPPDESTHNDLIQSDIDVWRNGWSASPFRGGQLHQYLWHFYLTDHPGWGRLIPSIFAGSIEPWLAERRQHPESYHCFFNLHQFIHLWDAVEDSPLFSNEDRRQVVTMFGHLLKHLAGLFYLKPEINLPDEPRQNHSTFIALDLAFGHDYMMKRYGIQTFEPTVEAVDRIFTGQGSSYKPNDDAGVGYAWHVPQETFFYFLYKQDYRYLDDGPITDLCRLAVVTTDNMRSESGYGDIAGYTGFSPDQWQINLWPLMASTWRSKNPAHLWTLNWLGAGKQPALGHSLTGLYSAVESKDAQFVLDGIDPLPPDNLLGIHAMAMPESALRWIKSRTPLPYQPDPSKKYFDKISIRPSFDPEDEYLLLEGAGTFCHGHEDTNAIIRLTWRNRAWLADGDYIRAAPRFHNAITVVRDGAGILASPGEGVVIPPLSSLTYHQENDHLGLLRVDAADYNGVDWQRHIFWGKKRYLVVMDQLKCTTAGDYQVRCLWRLVGEVHRDGATTRLHQQGEHFYIHNLDGARQQLRIDPYEAGAWKTYPYATPDIHELHQITDRFLNPEDALTCINLLTPDPDIRVVRLADGLVKIIDGETITILGIGPVDLGAVTIEGVMFGLTLSGDTLLIEGVQRIGTRDINGLFAWTHFDGEPQTIHTESGAIARHLKTIIQIHQGRPALNNYCPVMHQDGHMVPKWQSASKIPNPCTMDTHEDLLVCSGRDGLVVSIDPNDGHVLWEYDCACEVSVLKVATLSHGNPPHILIGSADSQLIVLNDHGEEEWQRPLKNISGRGERVSDITTADLYGDGQICVLAGTAGWYVNVFTSAGDPLWAEWFRYHPITRVLAADVDGDGQSEVMVGNIYSTPLTVHNADGSFRWSTLEQVGAEGNATTPRRGIHLTQMILKDINHDGIQEIIYGTADGWIYAVTPQNGTECWRTNVVGEVVGLTLMPEGLAVATEFGALYGFQFDGTLCWYTQVNDHLKGLASIGEDLLLIAPGGLLLKYDAQGHPKNACHLDSDILEIKPYKDNMLCLLANGVCVNIPVA
jgi:outer membrane protein assembly factor BamB